MASTKLSFGNKEITIRVTGSNEWTASDKSRVYFDLKIDGKANPLSKLYEIKAGSTADQIIEYNGRTFGYVYGFCDSKTKRAAVDSAVSALVAQIA